MKGGDEKLIKAVRAAKNREEEGFDQLYRMTRAKALAVIRRYCGEKEEWEDILQETYLRVFRFIGTLRDERKAQAWINRIAANLAVRSSMEKRPLPFSGIAGCKGAALAAEETVLEDPAVIVFRGEIIRMTMEVLRELPGKQRAALWMVYGMNLSIKEAAIKLKVPENTVKSRLFRGRQRFLERSEAFVEMGVFLTPAALPSLIAMAFAGRELFRDNLNQY